MGIPAQEPWGSGGPAAPVSVAPVELVDLEMTYGRPPNEVRALRGLSVTFTAGSFTAVIGPSGSGKSTFLLCAAGLETPTGGQVYLEGQRLGGLDDKALSELRRDRVGFVFQSFLLIESLTAAQNVALPLRLAGRKPDEQELTALLRTVGLEDRAGNLPAQLSGGQQQRVAIARALATEPAVIFADEPTGALDGRTGRSVLALLRRLVDEGGVTLILVTHDPVAASFADRVLFLADGAIHGVLDGPTAGELAAHLADLDAPSELGELDQLEPLSDADGPGWRLS